MFGDVSTNASGFLDFNLHNVGAFCLLKAPANKDEHSVFNTPTVVVSSLSSLGITVTYDASARHHLVGSERHH